MLALIALLACDGDPKTEADSGALVGRDSGLIDDSGADDSGVDDSGADDSAVELWDITWDEGCNPLSMASDCLSPYPSTWWTVDDPESPTGLRLDLHNEAFVSPDGPLPLDLAMFNEADGVSVAHPVILNLGVDVEPSFLAGWGAQADTVEPGAPIALLNAETGEAVPLLIEMDAANRELDGYEGRHALILRPLAPMEYGARYVVAVSSELTDVDGQPFASPEVFVALRDARLTSDPAVEAMRPRYEELFATLEAAGHPREGLLLAWELQVVSEDYARGPLLSMKEQALTTASSIDYEIEEIEVDPNVNVAWLVRGTFTPMSFLVDNTLALDADLTAIPQEEAPPSYDFTLVIPPQARDEGYLPLALIGHGMFGTGEAMLRGRNAEEIIQPFAARHGVVLLAADWIGFSGGDLQLIATEILSDLSRMRVITDRLAQSHVNQLVLVERVVAGLGDDPRIGRDHEDPLVDPERVWYYGISLGGIQGATQVGISPRISRAVLAVPGAGWANMIQRSTQLSPLEAIMDALYPDPLSQLLFLSAAQGFFDRADPVNFAPLVSEGPELVDASAKVVVIQEAIGDCQVPNLATDLLARAMGASHLEEATDPVFGLDTITGPTTGPALTQIRVPELLAEYFPPDENTRPVTDNGVHNAAVLQPATFAQIDHLFETGELIHPCDGVCDPD